MEDDCHSMGRGTLNISDEVLKEFNTAVFAKHRKLHGKIREEAEAALRNHAASLRKKT